MLTVSFIAFLRVTLARYTFARAMFRVATLALAIAAFGPATVAQSASSSALKSVNAIRAAKGLPKLAVHPALVKAAREQADLMAHKGKMAHKVSVRHSFRRRMARVGWKGTAAENIARGQPSEQAVIRAWMSSRGHRRNILNPRMRYIGMSANRQNGRPYWAMVLGG
ncbi:MAG: CAP domain-containing protein [Pseudomonadota bacterium]